MQYDDGTTSEHTGGVIAPHTRTICVVSPAIVYAKSDDDKELKSNKPPPHNGEYHHEPVELEGKGRVR